jgi:hypothetical protein
VPPSSYTMRLAPQLICRRLRTVRSSASVFRRTLTISRITCQATPNEDDAYLVGYPTPEQEEKMWKEATKKNGPRAASPMDVHTVEDIHHLTAEEALRETGTRKDATLRHFTGMCASFSFLGA